MGVGGWRGQGGLFRRQRIRSASFYKWNAKFAGMVISEAKRLKALEDEKAKLKKLLAETMLDIASLKDVDNRKWQRLPPSDRTARACA